ncbi:glycosyltransferase family 4 protein [Halorubrum sodomense]|uniref:glycosyltransferase family 4 protein n=1 Tax=Halorubrum sodomense TaxID=35743 RepID=UPI001431C0AD|nr:glycosyltransferase family 4 protein [Halorubrum sodomense]
MVLVNRDGPASFITTSISFIFQTPVVIRLGGDPWQNHHQKIREYYSKKECLGIAKHLILYSINHLAFRSCSGFIVVSNEMKDIVCNKLGVYESDVQVVHSSVDMSPFFCQNSVLETADIQQYEQYTILTVANLDFYGKYDGICRMLPSIRDFLQKNKEAKYIIAGSGIYLDKLESEIDRINNSEIKERIELLGYVDNVVNLYEDSDVFVYCSFFDGYPNVILEAQLSGIPVITNAKHGMIEQVVHNQDGYLIDEPSEFEYYLDMLYKNPKIYDKIVYNAKKKVIHYNNHSRAAEDIRNSIGKILNG